MRRFPFSHLITLGSTVLSLFFIFILSSCIRTQDIPVPLKKSLSPDSRPYDNNLSEELTRYEKILTEDPDRDTLASAYLRLASLYSSHRNPSPDYARALKFLNNYSELEPDKAQAESFQYWYSILLYISKLRKQHAELQKENAELKEVIEQLKHLDIRIEERRKQVK